eukprot:CAMPEP_0197675784 /NCGR_PEP_ID=MMETSP1338-20131121/85595_1 /TAXON_ID=43686 ORGANISM="Pelagodinium beii, Strain RCC1491" /NCGR_SAMPLE_ID=MMETSP1338 /ASSEMBLY_ACC=CAM_ASM_000754 /LENGTH=251 /DNA_ID=CAMNT_0043256377 /DNA_START=19 /DNA_END=774 /DNA_ORIENTATION=+
MAAAERSPDVVLCWMVRAPDDADPVSEVLSVDQKSEMRERVAGIRDDAPPPRLFVTLGKDIWGLAGSLHCSCGLDILRGLCQLEGLTDGEDFLDFSSTGSRENLMLVKQDLFLAFLSRAWAREKAFSAVRPLLNEDGTCPFSQASPVHLGFDEAIAVHYLELMLGRGTQDKCPLAMKYLQGIARDMQLSQQPYFRAVLEDRFGLKADDSVLGVLQALDVPDSKVPRNIREDLALGVAVKALELVQVMGLDL